MHKDLVSDWEFNVLNIYNYRKSGKLDEYFKFVEENQHLPGNIAEVGVFKGSSFIAMAMFLREIGSTKKVVGFDSFSGFPSYHANDQLTKFDELLKNKQITEKHYEDFKKNVFLREFISSQKMNEKNISSSGDFSDTSRESLERKMSFLGLENYEIIEGKFEDTLGKPFSTNSFMSILMDCDLYESHKLALNSLWPGLSLGGYAFLDEYYSLKFPGARIAVDEFFKTRKNKPQQHKMIARDFERWFVKKTFEEKHGE